MENLLEIQLKQTVPTRSKIYYRKSISFFLVHYNCNFYFYL